MGRFCRIARSLVQEAPGTQLSQKAPARWLGSEPRSVRDGQDGSSLQFAPTPCGRISTDVTPVQVQAASLPAPASWRPKWSAERLRNRKRERESSPPIQLPPLPRGAIANERRRRQLSLGLGNLRPPWACCRRPVAADGRSELSNFCTMFAVVTSNKSLMKLADDLATPSAGHDKRPLSKHDRDHVNLFARLARALSPGRTELAHQALAAPSQVDRCHWPPPPPSTGAGQVVQLATRSV